MFHESKVTDGNSGAGAQLSPALAENAVHFKQKMISLVYSNNLLSKKKYFQIFSKVKMHILRKKEINKR